MAQFIDADQASIFHKGLFGNISSASLSYLQGQIASLKALGGDLGQQLYQRSVNMYEAINGTNAVMTAKAVLEQVNAHGNPDTIRSLSLMAEFQTAQPTMINWLMADPIIRQLAYDGRISGWAESYVDPQPGKVGEQQKAYRQMMDGVCQDHPEASFKVNIYHEGYANNQVPLDIRDLANIFTSRDNFLNLYHQGGEDPSNEYGGTL